MIFHDFNLLLSKSLNKLNNCKKSKKQIVYTIGQLHHHKNLSDRQLECLFLLMRGKTSKQIAAILELSPRTIETHIEDIKEKFNCQSKSELIEKAINEGFMHVIPESFIAKNLLLII
jgi:DNA-binding CsgD family transcriptional regulator